MSFVLIYSPFGLAFISAAEETGVDTKHENFDSCVVSVPRDALLTFVDHLSLSL